MAVQTMQLDRITKILADDNLEVRQQLRETEARLERERAERERLEKLVLSKPPPAASKQEHVAARRKRQREAKNR